MNNPFKSDRNIFGNISKPAVRIPQQQKQQQPQSKISQYKPYLENRQQKLTFGKQNQSQIQKDFTETRNLIKQYQTSNPYDNRSSQNSQMQQYYKTADYQFDSKYMSRQNSHKQVSQIKNYGSMLEQRKAPSFTKNKSNKLDEQFLNLDAISEDLSKLLAQSKTQQQFRKILGMNAFQGEFKNNEIHQNYQLKQHKNQHRSYSPQPLQYHESKTVQINPYIANKPINARKNNWISQNNQQYNPNPRRTYNQQNKNEDYQIQAHNHQLGQQIQTKQTCYFNPHQEPDNLNYNFVKSPYEQPQNSKPYYLQPKQKSKIYPEQVHRNKFRDQEINLNHQRQFQHSNTYSQSFRPFPKPNEQHNPQKNTNLQLMEKKKFEEKGEQFQHSERVGEKTKAQPHQDRYEIKQIPQVFEYVNQEEDYGQSIQEILKRQMEKLCTKGRNRIFLTATQKIETVVYQFQPL